MKFDDLEVLDLNEEIGDNIEGHTEGRARERKEEPINWKREILSWVLTLVITVAAVFLLKNYVILNATVPTGSMENTILPGDNLLGYRLAYLTEEPERGDIIFFYFPDDESQKFVKRIIGLPGERVTISEGKIYINDEKTPLEEPYLKEEWIAGDGPFYFEVPEGCYLVLGDNRNTSQDARYWANKYVAKEKIIGKAIFTYYPFDRMGVLE